MKRIPLLTGVGLILALGTGAVTIRNPAPSATESDEAKITRVTAGLLEQSHFSRQPLDDKIATQFIEHYLDTLDPSRVLFLQTDVDEFAGFQSGLRDRTILRGDTRPAYEIFDRFLQRVDQRLDFTRELLQQPAFDFSSEETFNPDRRNASRPKDLVEARSLWRQQLRSEYLQEKLEGKKSEEIVVTLRKRYEHSERTMKQLDHDSVFEIYLTTLAHVYDPHSDYMGHREAEDFSIAMNLSLCGIGATLQAEEGYCRIQDLVTGGPAARSGLIKPGDRILAVAEEGKSPVEIIDMPLGQAVALIRGPKGTKVHLTVAGASGDSRSREVTLVRDDVRLEDREAKARIIDLPTDPGRSTRLGLIALPSFYSNADTRGRESGKSSADDVARLIQRLKRENVRGIVLDLRGNGGGSLEEAVRLAGLFIPKGPIAQTRDTDGNIQLEMDPDESVAYDGPLIVLTSRSSASASEIVAGALKDYGRALIVGESSTFGKGTVQNMVALANVMQRTGLPPRADPGALKLTTRKFYLPGGASTQLKGVIPDIVLPSLNNYDREGEASMYHALPWDRVAAARFRPISAVAPYLAELRSRSEKRVNSNEEFKWLAQDISKCKAHVANSAISLNEAQRRLERAEAESEAAARNQHRVTRLAVPTVTTFAINVRDADNPQLPNPESSLEFTSVGEKVRDSKAERPDLLLHECLQILNDYVNLGEETQIPAGTSAARS